MGTPAMDLESYAYTEMKQNGNKTKDTFIHATCMNIKTEQDTIKTERGEF